MKLRVCLTIFFILFCNPNIYSQEVPKPVEKPLIILYVTDPWLDVIGSDSPVFALYDSGLIIFLRHIKENAYEYASVTLNEEEKNKLIKTFSINKSFYDLDLYYSVINASDQPNNILFIGIDKPKMVTVYGDLKYSNTYKKNDKLNSFYSIYKKAVSYDNPNAIKWLPDKIEIILWTSDKIKDEATVWPSKWPDLNDAQTIKRKEQYSVFLDAKYFDEFRSFRKELKYHVVLMNGKKFYFSYRFPFPHETRKK